MSPDGDRQHIAKDVPLAGLLKTGQKWMRQTLAGSDGEEIFIHPRNWSEDEPFSPFRAIATIGRTEFKYDSGDGIAHTWESRDFIVQKSYMIYTPPRSPSFFCPPKTNWLIEWLNDGMRSWFEVFSPGDEPVWRWTDSFETAIRIHTKGIIRNYEG